MSKYFQGTSEELQGTIAQHLEPENLLECNKIASVFGAPVTLHVSTYGDAVKKIRCVIKSNTPKAKPSEVFEAVAAIIKLSVGDAHLIQEKSYRDALREIARHEKVIAAEVREIMRNY